MAVTNSAIYFLCPDTLQTLIVTQQRDSCSLKVGEDGCNISFRQDLSQDPGAEKLEEKRDLHLASVNVDVCGCQRRCCRGCHGAESAWTSCRGLLYKCSCWISGFI
ncbi:uncharacterized protein LOC124270827 [Haliotis rubra]|uniref:uncharacterized protein LOC124270827 n=1 Tax=Haliotis rubra TaxID=36100 RepID=UPI001EE61371|nr:uncharacterized protein LOC124270827 [Haliotis rubra]